jgi:hypothetical protein
MAEARYRTWREIVEPAGHSRAHEPGEYVPWQSLAAILQDSSCVRASNPFDYSRTPKCAGASR